MKKLVSWFLTVMMLASLWVMPAMAEENVIFAHTPDLYYVEANEEQVELVALSEDAIIEVDGFKFKDLNNNGSLDVYEDWRADVEDRITDLLSQMTLDEKVALLFHTNTGGQFSPPYPITEEFITSRDELIEINGKKYMPMWYAINVLGCTHYLDNISGAPQEQATIRNIFQGYAEQTRLGVPITFSSDREYNTWGSMVDMAHYAFGTAGDKELLEELVSIYAKEMRAMGFHVLLHSYGVEIGSWYGDNPNYIAEMAAAETEAIEQQGIAACTKHFIARGGRSTFADARSVAQLYENWMVPWQAVIDAGTSWIMTNTGNGLTNTVMVDYDRPTMEYLRETLGFDGVVVTDWGSVNGYKTRTGVTVDGVDLETLTLAERYVMLLENGVDQFGTEAAIKGTIIPEECWNGSKMVGFPDVLTQAVKDGLCNEELINTSARRILRTKFNYGLFENPYTDPQEVLEMVASDEYVAEQFPLDTIEDLYKARSAKTNELEIELQTKSAVLLKNDNVLPLKEGSKVYVTGNSGKTAEMDKEAIAKYAQTVEEMSEADVVVARVTALDDAAELIIDDAKAAGVPLVLALDGIEPTTYAAENSAAMLFMTYKVTPDHGFSYGNFFLYTLPSVLSDMLFGQKEPTGTLIYEVGRTEQQGLLDFGNLQYDTGMGDAERLYIAQLVKRDPSIEIPTNLGDVLYTAGFGMRYNKAADITCSQLVMPTEATVTTEPFINGRGEEVTLTNVTVADKVMKAGQPFEICFVAENNGDDGYITAEVFDGDEMIASKLVALDAGQFRVVTFELTLDAGVHEISVCGLSKTITVE